MATALISLASSVVGGLLVLAGQWLIHRSEDRRGQGSWVKSGRVPAGPSCGADISPVRARNNAWNRCLA